VLFRIRYRYLRRRDAAEINHLQRGGSIYEPGREELVRKNLREGRLRFTTDLKEGVEQALVIFLAVGTPPQGDGSADLRFVDAVAREVAETMDGYKVIVSKSTVPVGTGERVAELIRANQKTAVAFDVVSNPEFLREGRHRGFMREDRVVIGASSEHAIAIMRALRPLFLIETPFDHGRRDGGELKQYPRTPSPPRSLHQRDRPALRAGRRGRQRRGQGHGPTSRIGSKFLHAGAGSAARA
jgi:UDPglucose 6-dehydrogenase